jgi:hypothetical protein
VKVKKKIRKAEHIQNYKKAECRSKIRVAMYRKRIKLHAKFDVKIKSNAMQGKDAINFYLPQLRKRNTKPKFIKIQWKCIEKD